MWHSRAPISLPCTQNPEAWLKKALSIKQLSLSLDQHNHRSALRTPAPTPRDSATVLTPVSPRAGAAAGSQSALGGGSSGAHTYQPLLRVASVQASALLPAFAWLEVGGKQGVEPVALGRTARSAAAMPTT